MFLLTYLIQSDWTTEFASVIREEKGERSVTKSGVRVCVRSVVANCWKCAPKSSSTSTLIGFSCGSSKCWLVALAAEGFTGAIIIKFYYCFAPVKAGKVGALVKVAVREWAVPLKEVAITCLCTLSTRLDGQSVLHSVPSLFSLPPLAPPFCAFICSPIGCLMPSTARPSSPRSLLHTHTSLLHFSSQASLDILHTEKESFPCLLVLVLLLIIVHRTTNQ